MLCSGSGCGQKTFREQVPDLTRRWARRTTRATTLIAGFGIGVAGRAGSRLLAVAGLEVSRDTVLRVVMNQPLPFEQACRAGQEMPTVIGVDDVAIRRGQKYATIIIDAVTHQPLDLLPDRRAATLRAWLQTHPGVEVVCRDGSSSYAEAVRDAVPDAVQVSDRWHLWHAPGRSGREDRRGPPWLLGARCGYTAETCTGQ